MEGEGVADVIKTGLKKGSRIVKSQIRAKGKVTARPTANKKINALKRKIQS